MVAGSRVEGNGIDNRTVTIRNAGNSAVLGTTTIDDDEWDRRFRNLSQVPCTAQRPAVGQHRSHHRAP